MDAININMTDRYNSNGKRVFALQHFSATMFKKLHRAALRISGV